jgi:hypothetical protein
MRLVPLFAILLSVTAARAEPTGVRYHGAGGPFAGVIALIPRGAAPLVLVTSGGYGYSYFFDGRVRLGGGGQGTLAAFERGGETGSIGWGTIHLGWDPLAEGRWEFPLGLFLGGGRYAVERTLESGLVDRQSQAFFALQASASVEYHLFRTLKLVLMASWLGGINETGLAAQAFEGSLRIIFMLPLRGQ